MAMKNKTRRALVLSVLSLILCCAMLVGTTFAWFTDTAASGVNTINSGNLDIEVKYAYPSDAVNGEIPEANWKTLDENTPVFNKDALWEPGYTEVVYFKLVNKGTLSLQFQLHADILKEVSGINVAGELFTLSDYIMAYVNGAPDYLFELYDTRDEALNPPYAPSPYYGTLKEVANLPVATPDDPDTWLSLDTWNWLAPAEEYYCTMVLFMPTTVGNEANYKTGELAPSIDLGINFVATQYNHPTEKDSYDNNYDVNAEYPTIPAPAIPDPAEDIVLGDNFEAGETASFANQAVNGKVTADKVFSQVSFEQVSGKLEVELTAENTIILEDCNFDSLKVTNMPNNFTNQICVKNVTVNGEKITRSNFNNYFFGYDVLNINFY